MTGSKNATAAKIKRKAGEVLHNAWRHIDGGALTSPLG